MKVKKNPITTADTIPILNKESQHRFKRMQSSLSRSSKKNKALEMRRSRPTTSVRIPQGFEHDANVLSLFEMPKSWQVFVQTIGFSWLSCKLEEVLKNFLLSRIKDFLKTYKDKVKNNLYNLPLMNHKCILKLYLILTRIIHSFFFITKTSVIKQSIFFQICSR